MIGAALLAIIAGNFSGRPTFEVSAIFSQTTISVFRVNNLLILKDFFKNAK